MIQTIKMIKMDPAMNSFVSWPGRRSQRFVTMFSWWKNTALWCTVWLRYDRSMSTKRISVSLPGNGLLTIAELRSLRIVIKCTMIKDRFILSTIIWLQICQSAEHNIASFARRISECICCGGDRWLRWGCECSDTRVKDVSRQEKHLRDTRSKSDNRLTYSLSSTFTAV